MKQEGIVFIVIALVCLIFMFVLHEAWPLFPFILALWCALESFKVKDERPPFEKVLAAMSEASGLEIESILRDTNKRDITSCRYLLFLFLYDKWEWTTGQIGREFSRDHSTVTYGIKRARDFLVLASYEKEQDIYARFLILAQDIVQDK